MGEGSDITYQLSQAVCGPHTHLNAVPLGQPGSCSQSYSKEERADEMAQQVKALGPKPDCPASIPRTHTEEGENPLLYVGQGTKYILYKKCHNCFKYN